MSKQLWRLTQVREAVGLSRSEIYRLISLERFPANVPLGDRIVAWDSEKIQDFINEKISANKDA